MQLLFDPAKLPRSMTRSEWRKADRWRRVVQGRVIAETYRKLDAICRDLIFYGMARDRSLAPCHQEEARRE
jgi:hypothetical protein